MSSLKKRIIKIVFLGVVLLGLGFLALNGVLDFFEIIVLASYFLV